MEYKSFLNVTAFFRRVKCLMGRVSIRVKCPTMRSQTGVKCRGVARGGGGGMIALGIDWYISICKPDVKWLSVSPITCNLRAVSWNIRSSLFVELFATLNLKGGKDRKPFSRKGMSWKQGRVSFQPLTTIMGSLNKLFPGQRKGPTS